MALKSVVTDSDRTERVPSTLPQELSAIAIAILDKESERTEMNKKFNSEIKKLKARLRDVATAIKSGGMQLELSMFPETVQAVYGNEGSDEGETH